MKIGWTPKSIRAFKRLVQRNPQLRLSIEQTLLQMAADIYHPSLKTHKLMGNLEDVWSCSIDYSHRILFEFLPDPETDEMAILLLNVGSHDDVY
jgi:mRNA-degrading endonuclease YafQ of YafQ-DinJ toxin-antitoxin module